jgi:hypothetical protein
MSIPQIAVSIVDARNVPGRQPGVQGWLASCSLPPVWRNSRMLEKNRRSHRSKEGRIGWILLWLLGIPLPILFGAYFLRGCT